MCCELHSVLERNLAIQVKVTLMQLCVRPNSHRLDVQHLLCVQHSVESPFILSLAAPTAASLQWGVKYQQTQLTGTHCGSMINCSTASWSLSKALSRLSLTIVRSKQWLYARRILALSSTVFFKSFSCYRKWIKPIYRKEATAITVTTTVKSHHRI